MNPICVTCFSEMKCEENGVVVSTSEFLRKSGDKFKCKDCGFEIITGFGESFSSEAESSNIVN